MKIKLLITICVICLLCFLGWGAYSLMERERKLVGSFSMEAQIIVDRFAEAERRYTEKHGGRYPLEIEELRQVDPELKDVCGETISGYIFSCGMYPNGFDFIATPVDSRISKNNVIKVTGRVLVPEVRH